MDYEIDFDEHANQYSKFDSHHSDKSFDYLVPDDVPFDEVPRKAGDKGISAQGDHTNIDV
ncbi:hypothetical protein Tco_0430758, partial [Tanacetum coccineum]